MQTREVVEWEGWSTSQFKLLYKFYGSPHIMQVGPARVNIEFT